MYTFLNLDELYFDSKYFLRLKSQSNWKRWYQIKMSASWAAPCVEAPLRFYWNGYLNSDHRPALIPHWDSFFTWQILLTIWIDIPHLYWNDICGIEYRILNERPSQDKHMKCIFTTDRLKLYLQNNTIHIWYCFNL